MKEPTERMPSLSSGSEENADKFAKEIDPPPAYSLAAFCTKRKTNWNPTLVIAAAVVSALLVALLIGGLLFKIERLDGVVAERDARINEQKAMIERLGELCEVKEAEWKSGRQAEEPKEEEPGAEIRECWSRVSNLTKELAVHKQEAAARISRLEAEAGRMKVMLLNATLEGARLREKAKKLVQEKAEWTRKNDQLEQQRQVLTIKPKEPKPSSTATPQPPASSTSKATLPLEEKDCSIWCWVVTSILSSYPNKTINNFDTVAFIIFSLCALCLALVLLFAFGVVCCWVYELGCKIYGQRSPPLRYWGWVALAVMGIALTIAGLYWGFVGLRKLLALCYQ